MKHLLASVALASALVSSASAADLSDKSWDEILTQAKTEGKVTWYIWYFQDRFREVVKPFEEKYGIKVVIPEGTYAAANDKVVASKDREVGDIDVHSTGFDYLGNLDLPGIYMPLDMLPADDGRMSEVTGISGEGYFVAYWGNQTGLAYDPAKVSEAELPQTTDDLVKFWDTHPGEFGFNAEKGSAGPSFYMNILANMGEWDIADGTSDPKRLEKLAPGIDFFNEHAEKYVITASNVDSITRLSDGELSLVTAWEDHLAGLQVKGEVRKELKFYIPEWGMNGGGAGVGIPKNAPHPAAAAVLVNWLSSAEAQSIFNKKFGSVPMNANADDSNALASREQRKNQRGWAVNPFRKDVEAFFLENVILER